MKTTHIITLVACLALCSACSTPVNKAKASNPAPQTTAVVQAPVNMAGKALAVTHDGCPPWHLPFTKGNETSFEEGIRELSYKRLGDKKAECLYMTRGGSSNMLYLLTFTTCDSGTFKCIRGNLDILDPEPSDFNGAETGTFKIVPIPAGVTEPY